MNDGNVVRTVESGFVACRWCLVCISRVVRPPPLLCRGVSGADIPVRPRQERLLARPLLKLSAGVRQRANQMVPSGFLKVSARNLRDDVVPLPSCLALQPILLYVHRGEICVIMRTVNESNGRDTAIYICFLIVLSNKISNCFRVDGRNKTYLEKFKKNLRLYHGAQLFMLQRSLIWVFRIVPDIKGWILRYKFG